MIYAAAGFNKVATLLPRGIIKNNQAAVKELQTRTVRRAASNNLSEKIPLMIFELRAFFVFVVVFRGPP
jgi:hypothetical protein